MTFDINNLIFISYLFNPLYILLSLFVISLSLLIFYVIITKCDCKLAELQLILILNSIHLVSGISSLLFGILKLSNGFEYLQSGNIQCILYSFLIICNARFELFTVGLLAVMRYLIVCHKFVKNSKFWIITYSIVIIPVIGLYLYPSIIGDANPNTSKLYCMPYLKSSPSTFILYVFNSFTFVMPSWLSTCCYLAIGIKAYKKLNQLKKEANLTNDVEFIDRINNQKNNLVFQLIVVVTVFNLLYMPAYITMILRAAIGYRKSPIIDAISNILLEFSRAIDPLITIIFQPELNHEFKAILIKFKVKLLNFLNNLI